MQKSNGKPQPDFLKHENQLWPLQATNNKSCLALNFHPSVKSINQKMKAQFWDGKFLEQTINNLSWFIVWVKYPWWCCRNVTHLTPLSCVLRLIFVVLIEVFVTLFVVRSPSHVPIIDIKCPMAGARSCPILNSYNYLDLIVGLGDQMSQCQC